ncbi:MAG TPA: TauD/TfdA family dioxygenase [Rhodopila sp.]|nr:TauD/TfdA family dioxygenase [Rhodopila sp.]
MTVSISPLHPLLAARVSGVDLSQPVDPADFATIQAALDQYAVLVFQGPTLTPEEQVTFASRFGSLEPQNGVLSTGRPARVTPKLVDISNLDENNAVLGQADRRRMFALGNQLWHTDSSFKRTPASYSLLHAHTVPLEGGETQFVDMRVAWETLSPKLQARIADLWAEHSIFCSRAKLGFTEFTDAERAATPPVHRAVVRAHPGSGRKTLYLASHASHIVGWPVPDGRMLIHDLIEHATQPQFVYTHHWSVGDLVIWDNRCTMHRGRPYDEANHRRDLRRATIQDLDPAVQDVGAGGTAAVA